MLKGKHDYQKCVFFLIFCTTFNQNNYRVIASVHAYMSKGSEGSLPTHHIIQFGVVLLNRGKGYNAFDGVFVVPVTGAYVFTWSFLSWPHGWVYSVLMKNADVISTRQSESDSPSAWNVSLSTVVVDVSSGDHVYVGLGRTSNGRVASIVFWVAISLENKCYAQL